MLGADPEVFVYDKATQTIVPVCGKLGGTKSEPLIVALGALQEDNVLAEFNIDPASTEDEWTDNIQGVMSQLRSRLEDEGCGVAVLPSHHFDMEELEKYGDQALMAGCTPDFNAWSQRKNPRPRLGTLRTAAGHIHIGMEGSMADKAVMAKNFDLFLGVPSVIMDTDEERRSLYGKAGCFRSKPYGMEYRTLSNFWLANEELMRWAYRNSMRAEGYKGDVVSEVRDCIDNHNQDLARQLIEEYNLEVI